MSTPLSKVKFKHFNRRLADKAAICIDKLSTGFGRVTIALTKA
jgi:hypothetical protein